ncbi:hypothetical protein OF83DRAFT_170173 [Amylostereum chailletii]|nr:hypothetical protein OF83DRAFT_170173 [Amylostereum chailletii]
MAQMTSEAAGLDGHQALASSEHISNVYRKSDCNMRSEVPELVVDQDSGLMSRHSIEGEHGQTRMKTTKQEVPPVSSSNDSDKPAGAPLTTEEEILSILFPLLSAKYEGHKNAYECTGPNQAPLYVVAAAKFLTALGILDFPVFGLVTEGVVGTVICAWTAQIDTSEDP